MLISGLQKTTLVDYPAKVACIVFTAGCNFRCGFCHNPECVLPEQIALHKDSYLTEEDVFSFLQARRGLIDGVSICGGEPTLQSDLYDFIVRVKKMGFLVKLDTNGRDAALLQQLLDEQLVDYVAVDAKYPLDVLEKLTPVGVTESFKDNYERCFGLLRMSDVDYEYRTTVIKGWHDEEMVHRLGEFLEGAQAWYLQNYRSQKTLDPVFVGSAFTEAELEVLCRIGSQYVERCEVRD